MIKKILAPVDGSEHSKRALELACDLAARYDATLYLLHVILMTPTTNITLVLGGTSLHADAPRDECEKAGGKVLEAARQVARDRGIDQVETSIVDGPAAQRILSSARDNEVDMIVMGRRGASDIAGIVVGRVKHKVSDLAECICVTVP
ncbi:MAG: universal stress protein [Arenicellales bacterium]